MQRKRDQLGRGINRTPDQPGGGCIRLGTDFELCVHKLMTADTVIDDVFLAEN